MGVIEAFQDDNNDFQLMAQSYKTLATCNLLFWVKTGVSNFPKPYVIKLFVAVIYKYL
jgi:hypothetical protein